MGSESATKAKSAAKKATKSDERGRRSPGAAVRKPAPVLPFLGLQRTLGNRGASTLLGPPELFDEDARAIMDCVRIHASEEAGTFATDIDARAFAFGYDIVFGPGEFSTTTTEGRKLLAHELAHVLQQTTEGLQPATVAEAERDADAFAVDVIAGRPAHVMRSTPIRPARQPVTHPTDTERVPPRGTFYVYHGYDGAFVYVYNIEDVKTWHDEVAKSFTNYLMDAFPGATAEIAGEYLRENRVWIDRPDTDVPGAVHKTRSYRARPAFHTGVVAWMHQHYPDIHVVGIREGKRSLPSDEPPTSSSAGDQDVIEEVTVRGAPRAGRGKADKPAASGEPSKDPTETKKTTSQPPGGSIYSEAKSGTGDQIVYEPLGEMTITPQLLVYVENSSVTARVHFLPGNEWRYTLNIFPNHAKFMWTLYKEGESIDTNWAFQTGAIEYKPDFKGHGTYTITVVVSSREFIDDKRLTLTSPPLKVVKEQQRQQAVFESTLIGPEAGKPFEFDAAGKLKTKADWVPLSIQSEIDGLNSEIGAIEQLEKDGKISHADAKTYIDFFKEQLAGLKTIEQHVGSNPYVISGTFLNREDSTSFPIRVFMNQTGRGETDDKHAYVDVELYDSTLSPGEPRRSKGHGESSSTTSDPGAYAAAELDAISDAMGDWRHYNIYPDGTLHVGVQMLEGAKDVREWEIDTHTRRKTVRKVLMIGTSVAGVALLIASPFTAGATAPVGVLLLEGAVAGATIALVIDSIKERLNTGTFHFDARFVMDMTALVTAFVGVGGTFSRLAEPAATVAGRGTSWAIFQIGTGVTNFAAMSAETQQLITAENATFNAQVANVTDNATKADMEEKHRARLASIMGSACVSGSIIIFATGAAAKAALETEPPSGLPSGQRPPPEKPVTTETTRPPTPPPRQQATTEVQNPPAKLPPQGDQQLPNAPPPPSPPPPPPSSSGGGGTPDETITLFHGTRQPGSVEQGIQVARSPGEHQDFGQGFYLSEDQAVAEQAAGMRPEKGGTGMRTVMRWDIPKSKLGKIVDIRPGGANRAAWEAFLKQPPSFTKLPGFPKLPGFETNEAYLSGLGVERRGAIFDEFLAANNLSDADTIIGEIGTPTTSGAAALPNRVSTQVAIRSQKVADELNSIMSGPTPPPTTGGPPPPPPPPAKPPPPPRSILDRKPTGPGQIKATGPIVRVPVRQTERTENQPPEHVPANVLEIGAGPKETDLGLPPDPNLVQVTATDLNPVRPNVTMLDATKPIPPELRGKFDTIVINNPRGYQPDIENLGQALKPGGRIIIQGRYKGNPDLRPVVEGAKQNTPPPGYKYVGDEATRRVERFPDNPKNPDEQSPAIMGSGFGRTSGGEFHKPVNTRIIIEKLNFSPIPQGQTPESIGTQIGARVVQDVQAAKGTGGPSWVNRVLDAVRPLRLSPPDSAGVIESATRAAGYSHGLRTTLPDGTIVVTSARTGPNNFIVGIRPDGTIVRGMANIEMGANIPGNVRVSDVTWDQ